MYKLVEEFQAKKKAICFSHIHMYVRMYVCIYKCCMYVCMRLHVILQRETQNSKWLVVAGTMLKAERIARISGIADK